MKTTIDVPEDLWAEFGVKVFAKEKKGRQLNKVIIKLIERVVSGEIPL